MLKRIGGLLRVRPLLQPSSRGAAEGGVSKDGRKHNPHRKIHDFALKNR